MNTDAYSALSMADGFEWDDGNATKVRAQHKVEPGECEQVFFGAPLLVSADVVHSTREARWRTLGSTASGRLLYLVFTMRGSRIRVLSARPMNRKERGAYEQAQSRSEKDSDV